MHSTKGIIASTQPLANEAGYKILAKGGNAADAAVAVAAALNVTGLPHNYLHKFKLIVEPASTGMLTN